ncbi:hypothetical protein IL306_011576 [Fusarium sp. DS 682]|nr:hypothetical protein IL306_011576 [Fusarium sp. DS 682]
MSWKIWSDITLILSWFETDDVFTRLEILFEIACLLGGVFHFLYTGYLLPMVRGVMFCQALNIIVPAALWIASIHVEMPSRLGLIWIAITLDMCGQSILTGLYQCSRKAAHDKKIVKHLSGIFEFFPAVNIEHRVERTNAFVSLVFGYSVMGPMFQSHGGYTVDVFLGKAVLGLCQAFVFNWIYFDVDGSNINIHAIRRSVITSSAGLSKLVWVADTPDANPEHLTEHYIERSEPEMADGIRYFYCQGLAVALFFMGVISASHDHRHPATRRLSKKTRLANRLLVCLILFLLPLAKNLNSLNLISITLALSIWVLLLELFGKSCRNDPFIGEKQGCSVRYKCKCSKKDLENANMNEKEQIPSTEVLELGPREKTAVPDMQE